MPEVNAPLGGIVIHTFGVDAMDATKQAHSRRRPVASPLLADEAVAIRRAVASQAARKEAERAYLPLRMGPPPLKAGPQVTAVW